MPSFKAPISILLAAYNSDALLTEVFFPSAANASEIIIYDNGGNDNARKNSPPNARWIGDGKNIGLNAALNACAAEASHDYFYLPHTDMWLMPGWDTALLNACKHLAPHTFLFCSRSIEPTKGHTPFHIIKNYGQEVTEFNKEQLLRDFANHKDFSIVTGYRMPFFMHRKLWQKMNGVDANYFSYATDDDLFMEAYHAGVCRFWMINGSLVYHLQGKSNQQQKVDKDSRAPYEYFEKKWCAKGYPANQPIDNLVRSLIPWNLKIQ